MTPKEKADELINKYSAFNIGYATCNLSIKEAKQCVLICVGEILKSLEVFGYGNTMYDHQESGNITLTDDIPVEKYWQEVKQEIEKL